MTMTALLYPCLSVFALAGAAPVVAEAAAAVTLVQEQPVAPEETPVPAVAEPIAEPVELVATAGPKPVFADLGDAAVFERVADYIESIDTLETRFTQIAPSGNVSTGVMKLARPGRLRFDYDAPSPTLIIANQGLVYIHDTELETTDSYPVNKTPLKFLLAKDVDPADAVLRHVERTADSISLTLESSDDETEGQLVLEFSAPDLQLQRWAVYDPTGGVTVVALDELKTGMRIANNDFRVPEAGGSFLRDR